MIVGREINYKLKFARSMRLLHTVGKTFKGFIMAVDNWQWWKGFLGYYKW